MLAQDLDEVKGVKTQQKNQLIFTFSIISGSLKPEKEMSMQLCLVTSSQGFQDKNMHSCCIILRKQIKLLKGIKTAVKVSSPWESPEPRQLSSETRWHHHRNDWAVAEAKKHQYPLDEGLSFYLSSHLQHCQARQVREKNRQHNIQFDQKLLAINGTGLCYKACFVVY